MNSNVQNLQVAEVSQCTEMGLESIRFTSNSIAFNFHCYLEESLARLYMHEIKHESPSTV